MHLCCGSGPGCRKVRILVLTVCVNSFVEDTIFEGLYILRNSICYKALEMLSSIVSRTTSSVQRALPHQLSQRTRPPFPAYLSITTPRFIASQAEESTKSEHQAVRTNSAPPKTPTNPSFSLQDLGANRTVKVVVMASLSIIATMESIFWIKVGWAKFGPNKGDGSVINGSNAT